MTNTTAAPYTATDPVITTVSPNPQIGTSGDKVGFYGTTPITIPNVSGAHTDPVVPSIIAALVALGLITSSAT